MKKSAIVAATVSAILTFALSSATYAADPFVPPPPGAKPPIPEETHVAQNDADEKNVAQNDPKKTKEVSEKCKALAADVNADMGVMISNGCEPTIAQLSKLMDNPLGNVAMLFTQFDLSKLENPANGRTENQYLYTGIAQFPKKLSDDWNLISRVVWTVPSVPIDQTELDLFSSQGGAIVPPTNSPGLAPIDLFGGRTTGFGDMYYVGLFAPSEGIPAGEGANFLWGAGFDVSFPTATTDVLGSGKWSGGPSGLAVYMGKKWKVGALAQQYWDFAGADDRDGVNLTNLQYFIFYSINETTSIGAAPNIIANWNQEDNNRWTVPIGIGISKTFQIGKVPVRFGLEGHYSVVQPDTVAGVDWNVRFYVIPAIPSALIPILN